MSYWKLIFNLNTYLICLISLIAIFGDYMVIKSGNFSFIKAIFDNTTHAIIAGLCWLLFYLNSDKTGFSIKYGIFEICICALIASMIDLDHFIVARSFNIKDVTALPNRPFLHCSTIPIMVSIFLIMINYGLQLNGLKRFTLILLTAFMSHHIRDANRRGLWFYPFGSTEPIPYAVYIFLTCLVPYEMLLLKKIIDIQDQEKHINTLDII